MLNFVIILILFNNKFNFQYLWSCSFLILLSYYHILQIPLLDSYVTNKIKIKKCLQGKIIYFMYEAASFLRSQLSQNQQV